LIDSNANNKGKDVRMFGRIDEVDENCPNNQI